MKQDNLTACKDCKDRKVGCHGHCDKYKLIQAHFEKIRTEKKYAYDYQDYAFKIMIRNRGFSGERRF